MSLNIEVMNYRVINIAKKEISSIVEEVLINNNNRKC